MLGKLEAEFFQSLEREAGFFPVPGKIPSRPRNTRARGPRREGVPEGRGRGAV